MHRFRKRSDARRPTGSNESLRVAGPVASQLALPDLPAASDFRSSVILTEFGDRFTLLRTSSGDPVSLDDLRTRLAEQRAKGAENQISEEEEDMILSALNRMRARNAGAASQADEIQGAASSRQEPSSAPSDISNFSRSVTGDYSPSTSIMSSSTHTSLLGSPLGGSRSRKRHSNNLFSSDQFQDMRYINKALRNGSGRSALSTTPSDLTNVTRTTDSSSSTVESARPPSADIGGGSSTSTPNEKTPVMRSATLRSSSSIDEASSQSSDLRLPAALTKAQINRISTSLETVIREMEEENDQVLVPRSTPPQSSTTEKAKVSFSASNSPVQPIPENSVQSSSWIDEDAEIRGEFRASSPDHYPSVASPSPVPRVPGYIPGMPRPMTPRSIDAEDQRSHSTTPRAVSPLNILERSGNGLMSSISSVNGVYRRPSNASSNRQTPRPRSPITQRSLNGRSTPEERARQTEAGGENGIGGDSSFYSKRRPSSPLSSTIFQPMSGSRPSTPSNVTWSVPSKSTAQTSPANGVAEPVKHSREDSTTSQMSSLESSQVSIFDRNKPLSRSLRSPITPDTSITSSNLNVSNDFNGHQPMYGLPIQEDISGSSTHPSLYADVTLHSPTPANGYARGRISSSTPEMDVATSLFASPPQSPFSPRFNNPLMAAGLSNSSRSSLVSAGSSYHSWSEEHPTELQGFEILRGGDEKKSAKWHDLPTKQSTDMPSSGPVDSSQIACENILRQYTGLTKIDLASIQEKLIDAAQRRLRNPEPRTSALRRRRPSTAQSMNSLGGSRTTSPAPTGPAMSAYRSLDQAAKASALLNSLADSIPDPTRNEPTPSPPQEQEQEQEQKQEQEQVVEAPVPTQPDASSPARREKDLAEVLFGEFDSANKESVSPPTVSDSPDSSPDDAPVLPEPKPESEPVSAPATTTTSQSTAANTKVTMTVKPSDSDLVLVDRVPVPQGEPKGSQSAPATVNHVQLMMQVEQQANAAMAALRKPSNTMPASIFSPGPRRRIQLQDISSPTLVRSTTSVDKIPTIQPNSTPSNASTTSSTDGRHPSSKLSFRIKKLRSSLRGKHPGPGSEENVVLGLNASSTTINRAAQHSPGSATLRNQQPASASVGDLSRFNAPVPSPPASSGPSLKGFMSRFRRRGPSESSVEMHPPAQHLRAQPTSTSSGSLSPQDRPDMYSPRSAPAHSVGSVRSNFPPTPKSATASLPSQTPTQPTHAQSLAQPLAQPPTQAPQPSLSSHSPPEPGPSSEASNSTEEAAIKQLFEAGKQLGLPASMINEFLVRSNSLSSTRTMGSGAKSTLGRNNSLSASVKLGQRESKQSDQRVRSPTSDKHTSQISEYFRYQNVGTPVDPNDRNAIRANTPGADSTMEGNTVVRRTLIFPSSNGSNPDLANLIKKTAKSKKRGSTQSVTMSLQSQQSTRSVHDRVPTPPPPQRAKRFSDEGSPPVPRLPPSLSGQMRSLTTNGLTFDPTMEKSPNYDSLYEMYAGDRAASAHGIQEPPESSRRANGENLQQGDAANQAVEVIEMANGETIWSIVNGLRAEDNDSLYRRRISGTSDFSMSPAVDNDDQQLFFKEHVRNTSKGSATSFFSSKKMVVPAAVPGGNIGAGAAPGSGTALRPETKIFYSSSTQIARLIEQLSRGVDAGSFNILPASKKPGTGPGHSHSSSFQSESDVHWTVEERLEHMLGTMGASSS